MLLQPCEHSGVGIGYIVLKSLVEDRCTDVWPTYSRVNLLLPTVYLLKSVAGELFVCMIVKVTITQIETPGMPLTLRLMINDKIQNNQIKIQCDQSATSESTTTLFVIG